MLWFFGNASRTVLIATYLDVEKRDFVCQIEWPDGQKVTERFSDRVTFRTRLTQLEAELESAGYRAIGAPEILPKDWRGDPV